MDILQQATQTLSLRSAFTTHHCGASIARPLRTKQQASCKKGLGTTICLYSYNPNESERMLLASSNTTYAAPLEPSSGSSFIIRPLAEILRDLNKRVPDQVLKDTPGDGNRKYIPWYHANRMLSFYAPGWCGEVRNIAFSADGKFITVVYRVTLRGSDGEAYREASGTVCTTDVESDDPAQLAEELAFVRACGRFGLGLYLHHEQ